MPSQSSLRPRTAAGEKTCAMRSPVSAAPPPVAPDSNGGGAGPPPIPAALAAKVAPYTEFKPTAIASWHPERRELIVARRAGNVTQLHRVTAPGSEPQQLTAFSEPVRFGAYLAKKPGALVFARDTGGNEQRQLYRLDAATATPELLTDPRRKHDAASFTHARDYLLVASTDVDAAGKSDSLTTDLALLDPLGAAESRDVGR